MPRAGHECTETGSQILRIAISIVTFFPRFLWTSRGIAVFSSLTAGFLIAGGFGRQKRLGDKEKLSHQPNWNPKMDGL